MMQMSSTPRQISLETVTVNLDQENSIQLTRFGAHLISWRKDGVEQLFISERTLLDGSKPIRGGVPLVFPQFGKTGELPQHGFARTMTWDVAGSDKNSVQLTFSQNEQTQKVWPGEFVADLRCILSDRLRMEFSVTNNGMTPLSFDTSFHTYFKIADIHQTVIPGLGGSVFLDNAQNRKPDRQVEQELIFNAETDRVYPNIPATTSILDKAGNRTITIETENCPDSVIWNPWIAKCGSIADLLPNDYLRFVCVEPGNVCNKVVVAPHTKWSCAQTISIS